MKIADSLFKIASILIFLNLSHLAARGQFTKNDWDALHRSLERSTATFTVGENSATSRPLEQLCGLKPPKQILKNAHVFETPIITRGFPSKFDWREVAGCPPIKDQKNCGACWAFATIAPLECNILYKDGRNINLSEQWLISCNKDSWDCLGGWWAYKYLINPGAVLESDCPYRGGVAPCGENYFYPYRIKSWDFVHTEYAVAPIDKIKQAVMDYGPVSTAIYVGNAFRAYTGGIFNINESGTDYVNHGVTIVGWDDNIGGGCWIIRNSWGSDWGIGGYMYIKYGLSNVGYSANYVIYESGADFVSYTIDDDMNGMSCGNGNKLPEPGETIELGIVLKNNTENVLTDIEARISSDSMYLDYITSDTVTFEDMAPNEEKHSLNKYVITLADQISQGKKLKFNLDINSHSSQFHTHFIMPIHADPAMDISPDSLNVVIVPNDTVEKIITVGNTGFNPLNFRCGALDTTLFGAQMNALLEDSAHFGGPDNFGYLWIDSETNDGVIFNWVEINQIGAPLILGDDDHAEIVLPFSFPFYGSLKNKMLVSSNGYLTFGEDGDSYSFGNIPFPTEPNDFIAPFWCDLNPDSGAHGSIFFYHDIANHRIIIEWDSVEHNDFKNPETFQAILIEDGRIIFQYKKVNSGNKCTVGIENADGNDGLQIAFQKNYLRDGLAVLIQRHASWITFSPPSGTIKPDETMQIKVAVESASLSTGTHTARLIFNSNDPKTPCAIPLNIIKAGSNPYIEHTPHADTYNTVSPYKIIAEFFSNANLAESKLFIFWRTNDDEAFSTAPLIHVTENRYDAIIPAQPMGSVIEYYLFAENINGDAATLPQNAPECSFKFSIMNRPIINVHAENPTEFSFPPNERNTVFNLFSVGNDGTLPLFYEITRPPQTSWIVINPQSGLLECGDSRAMSVAIDTKDLLPGDYYADLLISSNDPINPQIALSVKLSVNEQIPNRKWTFMVYMDGDNDLEKQAIKDFLEITNANLNSSVAVLIQFDRVKGYDNQFGDWTICHRFAAQQGMTPLESLAAPDWGDGRGGREVNMGDPKTLADFISWGAENFPSPHYALILWDHGGGWRKEPAPILRDICKDITNNDILSTKEMGNALEALADKFDIIAMDACNMGMLEVAFEIRNKGSIMIASEGSVPLEGLPYTEILNDLCTSPSLSAAQFSKNIIEHYSQKYRGVSSLSACDLEKVEALVHEISSFASTVISNRELIPSIAHARRQIQSHHVLDETCDILDFANTLHRTCKTPAIKEPIASIQNALKDLVISSYSANCKPANGLSFYFPNPSSYKKIDVGYSCKNIQFACESTWDDMLPLILGSDTNPPLIQHSPLKDTLDTSGPYQIEAAISGVSAITNVNLYWSKGLNSIEVIPMNRGSERYFASFGSGGVIGEQFSYRIEAIDINGNTGYFPGPTEEQFWRFDIAEPLQGLWETFETGKMDLTNTRLTFIPDPSSPQRYRVCSEKITDWSINPYGGQKIHLYDNDFKEINIAEHRVFLYGTPYSKFFIGSNGYITFVSGDCDNSPVALKHFQIPRVALFYANFASFSEGMITCEQMRDRIVVSYICVNNNNMQAELGYDGIIRLTWLSMDLRKGIVGLSNGQGVPMGKMTDFSKMQTCLPPTPPEIEFETLPDFAGGFYTIAFTIKDEQSNPCNILAEFSADGGAHWQTPIIIQEKNNGTRFLAAPTGKRFALKWNTLQDLGSGTFPNIIFRITAYNMLISGLPADTPNFSIQNPSRIELLDYILARRLNSAEETTKLDVNHDGMIGVPDILFLINNGL